MTNSLWFILALIALVVEFMTGTFYLLVVAVALAGGGLAAFLTPDIPQQCLAGGIAGAIALLLVRQFKRHRAPPPDMEDPDTGARVRIVAELGGGRVRVFHRGTEWDAEWDGEVPEHQMIEARISGHRGNLLLIRAD